MKTAKQVRELQQELFYKEFPDVDERVEKTLQNITEALDGITDYSINTVTVSVDIYRNPEDNKPIVSANRKLISRVAKEVQERGLTMFPKEDDSIIISW